MSKAETSAAVDAIVQQRWAIRQVPAILGLALAFGWMILFGRGTDALEKTRFDLLGLLQSWGAPGIIIALLLGYGIAGALLLGIPFWVRRMMLIGAIAGLQKDASGHLCVCAECLYPMNQAAASGLPRCPECGAYFKQAAETDAPD